MISRRLGFVALFDRLPSPPLDYPMALVICRFGTAPRNPTYRHKLKDGRLKASGRFTSSALTNLRLWQKAAGESANTV